MYAYLKVGATSCSPAKNPDFKKSGFFFQTNYSNKIRVN